jgi:hypothetical protein
MRLQMLVEERLHCSPHHVRVELRATVPRAGDLVKGDIAPRPFQRLVEQLALMARHQGILLAVHDEERRCIRGHVFDGIGTRHLLSVFLDRAADQS